MEEHIKYLAISCLRLVFVSAICGNVQNFGELSHYNKKRGMKRKFYIQESFWWVWRPEGGKSWEHETERGKGEDWCDCRQNEGLVAVATKKDV